MTDDRLTTALDEPRRWMLIPTQIKVREFSAKVLLAAVAAERGWGTVLGTHLRLRPALSRFPPAVVFDYSVTPGFAELFRRYRASGHAIAATEEEGLMGHPMDALPYVDRFFTWGDEEASRARETKLAKDGVVQSSGNPRFDLLRDEFRSLYATEADALRARLGRYILVNTNFNANIDFGADRLPGSYRDDEIGLRLTVDFMVARDRDSNRMFREFQKMVPAMAAAFPRHQIVVRPHPTERLSSWTACLSNVPNAHVEISGPVIPWLLGADALVHNSCTTAIEGHLLGLSSFAYRPFTSTDYEWDLPNQVSAEVFDLDALIDGVQNAVTLAGTGRRMPLIGSDILAWHVSGMSGRLASERILDELDRLGCPSSRLSWSASRRIMVARDAAWVAAKHLGRIALRRTRVPLSFERMKNPGCSADEVQATIDGLSGASGRFGGIRAAQIATDIVAIVPTGDG